MMNAHGAPMMGGHHGGGMMNAGHGGGGLFGSKLP